MNMIFEFYPILIILSVLKRQFIEQIFKNKMQPQVFLEETSTYICMFVFPNNLFI